MINRRKAITYGKRRKPKGDANTFDRDGSSHIEDWGNWGDNSREKRDIDLAPAESFASQGRLEPHNRSHLSSSKKPKRVLETSLAATSVSKESSNLREPNSMLPTSQDDALFEVSSSGNEDIGLKEDKTKQRKRRKLEDNFMFKENSLVYDDESLQRHVAAESYYDQSQFQASLGSAKSKVNNAIKRHISCAPSKSPFSEQSCISETQIAKDIKDSMNQDKQYQDASEENSDLNKMDRQTGLVNVETQIHETRKPIILSLQNAGNLGAPEMKPRSHSLLKSDPAFTLPQTEKANNSDLSQSSIEVDKAATIQGLPIRNPLLNDNTQPIKSRRSKALGLTTNDQVESDQKFSCQAQNKTSNMKTCKVTPKRRKLVDHLNRDDNQQRANKPSENFMSEIHDFNSDEDRRSPGLGNPPPKSSNSSQPSNCRQRKVPQPVPIMPGGGLKVTYARQRSYLTNDDFDQVAVFDTPMANPLYGVNSERREVETTLPRLQANEIIDEKANEALDHQKHTMRSIYELREAGSHARSISEMEAMLDDIDGGNALSLSQKRSRLLELNVRLQELSFCRLFIDQGFDLRLFAHLDPSNDLFVGALCASIALQILTPSISKPRLTDISSSHIIGLLIELLDNGQDLRLATRRRDQNMSKVSQVEFEKLWLSNLESAAWRADRPPVLTVRVLCLQCLEYFVRYARESDCMSTVLSHQIIPGVSRILNLGLSNWAQKPGSNSLVDIQLALSVLESCTISESDNCEDEIWTGDTLENVTGLLPLFNTWSEEKAGTLRTLTLRLYLNLTNNSPSLCKHFARPDLIGSILNIIVSHFRWLSEEITHCNAEILLDNLILALGSMINLAEWCDAARQSVISLYYEDLSFVDTLLQLFMTKQKKAGEVRDFPTAL